MDEQSSIEEEQTLTGDGMEKQGNEIIGHFGNYDLVYRIDVGGMGEVYLARQRTAFGREVAVKIIRPDLAYDITVRKRFLREAEVNSHLKHDHILPLIEFSEHEGRLFLVTPYIKGGTLARRLRAGALPLSEVRRLFAALVRAVSYIHKRGVVHRDLKPSNILLDREEDSDEIYVRLIDFGIATIPGSAANPDLTASGEEIGTAAYMAPERLDGVAAPSNDIYSLGIILYQMLTGSLPDATQQLAQMPSPLAEIVNVCTREQPEERYPNADALLKAFERACRQVGARNPLEDSAPPTRLLPNLSSPALLTRQLENVEAIDVEEKVLPVLTTSGPLSVVKPDGKPTTEGVFIARADLVSNPGPSRLLAPGRFSQDDYNAPTSSVDLAKLAPKKPGASDPTPRKRGRGLVYLVSLAIVVVLGSITLIGYMTFNIANTATITIVPQVQALNKQYTITARLNQQKIDIQSATIPAYTVTSKKTGTREGKTGVPFFCIFCKPTVSDLDVNKLSLQMQSDLEAQIKQDLTVQQQKDGYIQIGDIFFNNVDGTPRATPPVGTESETVKVTLTRQGMVAAVKSSDARELALSLLKQEVPANFVLIDKSTQVSQPVLKSINVLKGEATLTVAAGGVARYQITPAQISEIQNNIRGMKTTDARGYLADQPGLDKENLTIHTTFGDTLPNNSEQIRITIGDPLSLPPVNLPNQPAVTPTVQN
jgi:serine/threonine protein kinase